MDGIREKKFMKNEEKFTTGAGCAGQLGFMIAERLGIEITDTTYVCHAESRINWLRRTLECNLPRWLKRMGINNMEKANIELHYYTVTFNTLRIY